jgi:uncharacterized protein YrrD
VGFSLRTFSLLKKLPIYEMLNGKKIGIVEDLCLDDNGSVKGLIVKRKGLFSHHALLPIDHITSFGHDGIMISEDEKFMKYTQAKGHLLCHPHKGIVGMPIMSNEGEKLGLVDDVYFNEELGTIVGYEVTDGFFADLKEGKRVIKADAPLKFGKDVLFVQMK